MTKEQLKARVQNHISRARVSDALKAIEEWARNNGHEQLKDDVAAKQGELRKLSRQVNLGLLSYSESSVQNNRIVHAALNLLDTVDEDAPDSGSTIANGHVPPSQLKILMLTANPANQTKLNLDKEHSVISERLQGKRDKLDLYVKRAVSAAEFKETTEEEMPQILHFSGHGTAGKWGGIFVQNDDKNDADLIPIEGLDALFEYFKEDGVELKAVVLNACHSEEQAAVVAKYVPHVIGTTKTIGHRAAIAFSRGFYYKLAEKDFDFEKAFKSGRTSATMAGASKSHFVIYKNGEQLEQ